MWTCPKCGRTFQRQEQGHYCGKAPETIEGYVEEQPEEIRQYLKGMRCMRRCRRRRNGYHGVCRLIGKSIISSSSPDLKTMWACIRGRRLSRSFLNV